MVAENIEPKEAKKTAKPKAQDDARAKPAAAPAPVKPSVKPAAKTAAAPKRAATKPAAPGAAAKPVAAKPAALKAPAAKPAPAAEPKKTAYQELGPEVSQGKAPEAVKVALAPKSAVSEPVPAPKAVKPVVTPAPAAPAQTMKPVAPAPAPKAAKPAATPAPTVPVPKTEAAPKAKKVKYEAPAKAGDKDVEIVDEKDEEDSYKAKAKPELSAEKRLAISLKNGMNAKRPAFHRQEWFRYQKLGDKWRKPKGIHSKMRRHYIKRPPVVSIGYRSPKETRDLHPSGFREIMIHNIREMEFINPKAEAARVAHGVGFAKLMRIVMMADQKGIRLLNISAEKQTLARKKAKEEGVKLPETGAVE